MGRTLLWANYLGALAMVLLAVAGGVAGVALLLAGRFVGAVSAPLFNVTVVSLRQARVSPSLLGRVNATFEFIDWGTLPIGSLLGGLIGAALGPRAALEVAAACGVLSALWIQFSPASRLTTLVAHIDAAPDRPSGEPTVEPGSAGAPADDEADRPLEPPMVA